jgi:hypothetical protein
MVLSNTEVVQIDELRIYEGSSGEGRGLLE